MQRYFYLINFCDSEALLYKAKVNMSKATKKANRANPANTPIDEKLCYKPEKRNKEYVIAYDIDGMRKLTVPDRNPIDIPGIFTKSELERLIFQSRIITLKDRKAMMDEKEKQKSELEDASQQRKELMMKAQLAQKAKAGTKLSDVQREAKSRNLYMLKRSHELLQEQDNRVKAANRIILATKCRAIRNAQIAEKELIEKQMQDENHRLDMMMEQERQKALQVETKRREEEEKKKQRYINELAEQMKYNEIERLCEAERIEEESKMINKALLALQKEEEQKQIEKRQQQQKVRDDLTKANEDLQHYRLIQKEEQRIADLRIQKFMQQKLERELAREQENQMAKNAKEQEIARMRQQQKMSQDHRSEVEEMNALRIQEEVEREWRRKEMLAAKTKKEQLDSLKRDREQQIEDIRKAAALRLARDEQSFQETAKIQKAQFEKEEEKKQTKKDKKCEHRQYLLKQINEKERERILMQKERFEEGKLQRLEQKRKDIHVEEHIKNKIQQLRAHEIPEHYIKEIEGHVEGIINSK